MKTPTIENIDDIRTSTDDPRLIHFTIDQWNKAIKGIQTEDFDPKKHKNLDDGITAYQNPDEVILYPRCEVGAGEICAMRQKFDGKNMELHFECSCRPKRGTPKINPKSGSKKNLKGTVESYSIGYSSCHLALVYDSRLKAAVFRCVGTCAAGNCRALRIKLGPFHQEILKCICGS